MCLLGQKFGLFFNESPAVNVSELEDKMFQRLEFIMANSFNIRKAGSL
jgi:hypothetical protein